jgi:hypothetical protein
MNFENKDFSGRPTVTANKSPRSRPLAYPVDESNPNRVTKAATEFMVGRRRDGEFSMAGDTFKCQAVRYIDGEAK